MNSYLQNKLLNLIENNHTTISAVERAADLGKDTLRNIINGRSKSPSLNLIHSVAKTLGANIYDFIEENNPNPILNERSHATLPWNGPLYQDVIDCVQLAIDKYKIKINFDEALKIIVDAYVYCLEKDKQSNKADQSFCDWIVKNNSRK